MKRCASLLAIARRAVEGRLYGLKVEKAHIRGKPFPLCSLTKHNCGFLSQKIVGSGWEIRTYEISVGSDRNLRCAYRCIGLVPISELVGSDRNLRCAYRYNAKAKPVERVGSDRNL